MSKQLTIAEAQQQLPDLPSSMGTDPVIITQDGKPVIVALRCEQFESLMETLEILSDREFIAQLQEGIQQIKDDETVTLEELRNKLGF